MQVHLTKTSCIEKKSKFDFVWVSLHSKKFGKITLKSHERKNLQLNTKRTKVLKKSFEDEVVENEVSEKKVGDEVENFDVSASLG